MRIRSGPQPGDIGAVTRLHGLVYAAEYDLDGRFEAAVAARLVELTLRGWPGPARDSGSRRRTAEPVGSITLADQGHGLARLGHFVLRPEARGLGLGRRLVDAALARAREASYERIELTTFSELTVGGADLPRRRLRAGELRRALALGPRRSRWSATCWSSELPSLE